MASKQIMKKITSCDLFGHLINLNFNNNKSGDSYKTCIGGLVSLFVKSFMSIFIIYNFKKLLLYEDDKQYNENGFLKLDTFGEINFNQTN